MTVAYTPLHLRDENWRDWETGKLVYDQQTRVKIVRAKLEAEYFPHRKPSGSQVTHLAAAAVLTLALSDIHADFSSGKPLPKNYLSMLAHLRAELLSLQTKPPRGKNNPKGQGTEGIGLASLLASGGAK
jgi:hypothetical protein